MNTPIYIAAYNQSKFGKLMDMKVPDILANAVNAVCRQIDVPPSVIDVGSVAGACSISLNEQGLLAGLVASVPGLGGKSIESVENACASGGIAVGYEKMRDAEGKMDGAVIGKVLGFYSHPSERPGKVYVFPHLYAEIMRDYMKAWGATEADLAQVAVEEYANAKYNPCAQMNKVQITLEQALKIEGINKYIFDGLPLKTYDCSQITDGYAALILATEEGLAKLGVPKHETVEIAGYGEATDPLAKGGRDVLRPAGAYRAMSTAYKMAGLTPADINVAEVHDCFR